MHSIIPLLIGWGLDLCAGDPARLPHPIVAFGRWISFFERKANHGDHRRAKGTFWTVTTLCTLFLSAHLALAALWTACLQWEAGGTYLYYLVTGILIFYCLAGTTLIREVRRVFRAADRSLEEGRRQVSRIVGRDTSRLSDQEIRTAALETLAENLSDGVIAPLFWLYVLGIPGMLTYKMINTMDSMIGYKNDKYLYFGRFAAKLDDVLNFIPSRIGGVLMVLSAGIASLAEKIGEKHYSMKNAWKIFLRDRKKHSSPNAAQTESACAGALKVALSGDNYYFGKLVKKPQIGDAVRPLEAEDIKRSHVLLYISAFLMVAAVLGLRVVFFLMI